MNHLTNLVGIDVLHALAWSLVHSIWQSGLVAAFLMLIVSFIRSKDASLRYRCYGFGLIVSLFFSGLTFVKYFRQGFLTLNLSSRDPVVASAYIPMSNDASVLAQLGAYINHNLAQIVVCWCCGFLIVSFAQIWHWHRYQILKRQHTESLPATWQKQFSALAVKMGLRQSIHFCVTHTMNVPCVIGFFKPALLLPASVLLGMSPQQIEVIVLHELAHIRRHDVLIANVQSMVKAVYFFNPFVLWISAQLDQERENACDDIAVSVCSNPVLYAKTLQHFAEMHAHFSSTIAITGRKNMLMHRIQRLFSIDNSSDKKMKKSISAMLLMSLSITTAAFAWVSTDSNNRVNLQAKNLPITQLMQQAEIACPGSTTKIKLAKDEAVMNIHFSNIACDDVPALFADIQTRFSMRFNGVKFHEALGIFKQQCPTVFRDIRLKNPEVLYSVNMLDVSCVEILNAVAEYDAQVK